MYEEIRQKVLAKAYDVLLVTAMVCASSLFVTSAVALPFIAFGYLHAGFCGK